MNTSPTDALALLQRHHRQLDELFAEVFDAEDAEQRGWAVQKAAENLAGLMEAEDLVLLPRLPHDDPVVLEAQRQHERMRSLAGALLVLAPVDDSVGPLARELHAAMQAHHRFEEHEFFPHVERELPAAERESLGTALAVCLVRLHAAGAPRRAHALRAAHAAQLARAEQAAAGTATA